VRACMRACVCAHACVRVHACIMCVCVRVCVFVSVSVCACERTYVRGCVRLCIHSTTMQYIYVMRRPSLDYLAVL